MKRGRREVATPLVDFAGVYRDHARDVHRFALFLSGEPALADDLVSEAFVRGEKGHHPVAPRPACWERVARSAG